MNLENHFTTSRCLRKCVVACAKLWMILWSCQLLTLSRAFLHCNSQARTRTPFTPPAPNNIRGTTRVNDDNIGKKTKRNVPIRRKNPSTGNSSVDQVWFQINNGGRKGADKALQLLGRLLKYDSVDIEKGLIINVLKACTQSPVDLDRLDDVFALLKGNDKLWDPKIPSLAVRAMARGNGPVAPKRALVLLQEVLGAHSEQSMPDEVVFNSLLNSLAKRGMAREARHLLNQMVELHSNELLPQGPDTMAYNFVMSAWAQSKDRDAPKKALSVLKRMNQESSNGNMHVKANLASYNHLLKAFASCGMAKQAENYLEQMVDLLEEEGGPDTTSYNNVMEALSNSRDWDAPYRAKTLIKHMESMREARLGVEPTLVTYQRLLNLYAKRGMARQAEELLQETIDLAAEKKLPRGPDAVAYNCVMNALARCSNWDAPFRAKTLLNHMENLSEAGFGIRPNVVTFASLLHCYANRGMANEAEDLLQQMHSRQSQGKLKGGPDLICYNSVMDALAKSGTKDSPLRGLALLEGMEKVGLKPNLITHNCLLKTFAKNDFANEAEEWLKRMRHLHRNGTLAEPPNVISFNSVLDALAKSSQHGTSERGRRILNKMRTSKRTMPNIISYTCLLNCYAREGMVDEAEDLLNQMHKLHKEGKLRVGPDRISYNCVMHALAKCDNPNAPERAQALLERMHQLHRSGYKNVKPDKVIMKTFRRVMDKAADKEAMNASERQG